MNIKYPLVIDGGLSNQLESQGYDLNHRLWTARLLDENPHAIKEAHMAYLEAGARCLITASYQATIPGLMAQGWDRDAAERLILKTADLALEAIKEFETSRATDFRPLVAASIGPYGAYLADGSEYTGKYGISSQELFDFHLPRMQILDHSDADLFACETLPCFQEAEVLADILLGLEKQAWVSFSCMDEGHICDGTAIETCIDFFSTHPGVFAVGVNCTAPRYISSLITKIKQTCGDKRVVVYPNSGEIYHAETKTWSDSSDLSLFQMMVNEWLDLGVDIIGGCCRLGPPYIKIIQQVVKNRS